MRFITQQESQKALNRSPEYYLKLTYRGISRKLAMFLVTPGVGLIWPQGNNLKKVGRGPLGYATNQISKL